MIGAPSPPISMLASAPETMAESMALLRAPDIGATSFLVLTTKTLFAALVNQGYGKLIA
jgi:hypothetical protein